MSSQYQQLLEGRKRFRRKNAFFFPFEFIYNYDIKFPFLPGIGFVLSFVKSLRSPLSSISSCSHLSAHIVGLSLPGQPFRRNFIPENASFPYQTASMTI